VLLLAVFVFLSIERAIPSPPVVPCAVSVLLAGAAGGGARHDRHLPPADQVLLLAIGLLVSGIKAFSLTT